MTDLIRHSGRYSPSSYADRQCAAGRCTSRLGNLVLAEEVINTPLGNKPFSEQRKTYKQSEFLLTRLLSGKVEIGKNTKATKALEGLPIPETWTSEEIEERQLALSELARQVWDMPKAKAKAGSGM